MISTVTELQAKASAITGLSEFGADDYTDGLTVLLESFSREAGLTEAGQKAARAMLRGALVARLLSEAGFAAHPEYASVPVARPIFVTGLPRTGTTFLHRLLVADPAHQGLELWLAEAPQPRPPRDQWADNLAYQFVAAGIARHQAEHPSFGAMHELGAGQVEECWQLLRQSMRSVSFECLAHLPTYSSWLAGQDWLPSYRRHRRNLQLIGLRDGDRRWVLKNPSHLFALDALMSVYPDALVIVTHRSPEVAMASMCSLAAHASAGWSATFRGPVIGADQLSLWSSGLARFAEARSRYAPGQFFDVAYDDLVADPMGTIKGVYEAFGLSLTVPAVDAMRTVLPSGGPGVGRPGHRYTLADFGLDTAQVARAFAVLSCYPCLI
ncbi:MAG TPA: sulfotransferase [Streptosporangiaceae bacterium]